MNDATKLEVIQYLKTLSKPQLIELVSNIYQSVEYCEMVNFYCPSDEDINDEDSADIYVSETGFYCHHSGEPFLKAKNVSKKL